MYAALTSMVMRQRRGRELAKTLEGWFAPTDIMLLEAGDKRGYESFAEAIDNVLSLQGAAREMIGYVLAGLFEPLVMLGSIYGLIVWLAGSFNDQVLSLIQIDASRLYGSARTLYDIGLFSKTIWVWIVPAVFLILMAALFRSLPGIVIGKHALFVSRQRMVFDKFIPPWSIYSAIISSQWMLSFSKLAQAGYAYEEILARTGALASPWLRTRLLAIEHAYRKGLSLGRAMTKAGYDFPSRDVIQDVATFANRPGFEESLQIIAHEWVKSVTLRVKAMSQAITGLGFLATGASMIWIMDAFNAFQNQITAMVQQMQR
jgi:type II secretory pathway component PulF